MTVTGPVVPPPSSFQFPLSSQLSAISSGPPAAEFSPKSLEAVRRSMIDEGNCRTHINKPIGRIKRFFKGGVTKELVPASVYHGLQAVDGLKRGRTEARESKDIRPVPDAIIDAILPHLTPTRTIIVSGRIG